MSIDKVQGGYKVRYRTEAGRAGRSRSKKFRLERDAKKFEADVKSDQGRGLWVDPSAGRITLGQYAEQWRLGQVHYSKNTASLVDNHLRKHILPFFGDRPIAGIRSSHLQSWVRDRTQVLAPSTVEAVYGRLVTILRAAVQERIIATNPAVGIKLPKVVNVPVVPLPVVSVTAWAEEMPERDRALIVVGAGLGLRQGEAFGLTVDRVDFLRRTVRIDQQVIQPDAGPPELTPKLKSDASYRTLPLPVFVAEALARHLGQFKPGPFGLIFTDEKGEMLRRKRWNEVLAGAVGRSGIRADATFHDLRHFYASALIFAGQSVKVVQARLGHASAMETLDTYGHLWPDDEDGTRQAIDGVFGRGVASVWPEADSPG